MNAYVVCVRHPDFANEYHEFGESNVKHVDIDLGSGFDVTQLGPDDWCQVLDWAVYMYSEADAIQKDSTIEGDAASEAASLIRTIAEETLAECIPYGSGWCNVEPFIRRARRLEERRASGA